MYRKAPNERSSHHMITVCESRNRKWCRKFISTAAGDSLLMMKSRHKEIEQVSINATAELLTIPRITYLYYHRILIVLSRPIIRLLSIAVTDLPRSIED